MGQAIVGRDDHLLNYLIKSIEKSDKIRLNVAFLMESGVKLISPYLEKAAARGVKIKVLTGRYMSVTEPAALYYLIDKLGGQLDIRFFSEQVRSFHPKAYILDCGEDADVFIGSSNLSYSALKWGLEWNYSFKKRKNPGSYDKFSETFNDIFQNNAEIISHDVLKKYAASWKKSQFIKVEQAIEEKLRTDDYISPKGAQIEALYELRCAREEGVKKGLVIAASGVGKTYLAAFDSVKFNKILFLAHREEILKQAEESFLNVRPHLNAGFYTGFQKDKGADVYFASVQTLSRKEHIKSFDPDFFDYIIIDEFHHAAANSYATILEYFEPDFLLGLTATPYRMDGQDIFSLCNDNVIYELYLKDAINRDLLAPFLYYGIYDNVDYDRVSYKNGKYDVEDLEKELARKERADLVLEKNKKLAGEKTVGFCVSIKHAEYMADYFNKNGIPAACLHSGTAESSFFLSRAGAVEALNKGKIKTLFVVDIFNEGVDIPSIDTVMFLRPTESFVVFLQQLGRGLRKDPGKDKLTVLDFIGNYKKAHYVPFLLAGENPLNPSEERGLNANELEYPENCNVQFDFKLLDLFEEMAKADPLKKRMEEDYFRVKEKIGRRPTRIDIFQGSNIPVTKFLEKGWLKFLYEVDDLNSEEKLWVGTEAEDFLKYLEKTRMNKAYKIPTIAAMIEKDNIMDKVHLQQIGECFEKFYTEIPLHQKDFRDKSNAGWRTWGVNEFKHLARKNPVYYLSKGKYFAYDEINQIFSLNESITPYLSDRFKDHVEDILEYRRVKYFKRRFREDD